MLALVLSLTILINEVLPAPASGPEWVELYNPSDAAIDVSGWRIDDDTSGGTQTIIAAGSVVPARGFLVVALTSAILNNTGDSATLIDTEGSVGDAVAFGAMRSTESYGRRTDGASEWLKLTPSAGASNALLVITTTQTATNPPTPTAPVVQTLTPTPPVIEGSETPVVPTPSAFVHTDTPTASVIPDEASPTPTLTPSDTAVPPPTATPTQTQTSSPTKTPSPTRTPSNTKTPSLTRTPSNTKTPSPTRTPSITKTPSPTRTPSDTKTPSLTRTASVTKTPSPTRTRSMSKTATRTKTRTSSVTVARTKSPSRTKTPSPTKTPSRSKTASATRSATQTRITRENRAADGQTPGVQTATATQPMVTQRVAPSPQLAIQNVMPPTQTLPPTVTLRPTTGTTAPSHAAPLVPAPPRTFPLMPLASVLLLAGWIGLRVFAKAAAPVLYSDADEEAESSASDLPSESRTV